MKIAVNTRSLISNKISGIGVFCFEIFKRITANHPEHTFYYIFDRPFEERFITSNNIVPIIVPPKVYHHPLFLYYWNEIRLPQALKKIKPDVYISVDGLLSLNVRTPGIIVIHDINFEHSNKFLSFSLTKYLCYFTARYVKHARHIVTVSEFCKNDIIKHYNVSAEKIDVVYNAGNHQFTSLSEAEKIRWREENTHGWPFFIFVGVLHPRKNVANQLRAFEIFRSDSSNPPHKFLIVGDKWRWNDEMEKVYNSMKYKDDVIFVGRLSSEELGKAISSSTALLYVSLFEGFGIPILEAFYAQTAVITSNVTSMPEVAQNAALLVDPYSPYEIAEAMRIVANNPEKRNELINSGNKRKLDFNWDISANKMWDVIERTLQ